MNKIQQLTQDQMQGAFVNANKTRESLSVISELLNYWIQRCDAAEALLIAIDCGKHIANENQANAFLQWQSRYKDSELNTPASTLSSTPDSNPFT